MPTLRAAFPLPLALLLAACNQGTPPGDTDGGIDASVALDGAEPAADLAQPSTSDGGLVADRPYHFKVPAGYDKSKPTPLVILLHGYSASGLVQDIYFGLSKIVDAKGFLYAYPDGTYDHGVPPARFWN